MNYTLTSTNQYDPTQTFDRYYVIENGDTKLVRVTMYFAKA